MHITRKWRRKWHKQLQHIQILVHRGLRKSTELLYRPKLQQAWRRQFIAASIIAALAGCGQVYALPQNGQIVDGSGTVSQQGNTLNVNQTTNKMIVDWQSFNIAKGETVNFMQPNSAAIALNRVLGNDVSSIYGALNANGKVFLINPNGIVFGSSAQVNTGSMVASTLNLNNADFMAGNYTFSGSTGKIENNGTLAANTGGAVTLIAPQIANKGIIVADEGSVTLAAGDKITLGDSLIAVAVNKAAVNTAIENGGLIRAGGGQVIMNSQTASSLASTLINTGTIEASSIAKRGGVISLVGNEVTVGGQITADGTTGGSIDIAGDNVKLANANISAGGTHGGGTIRVGGDYQGTGTLPHATTLSVDKDVTIQANAGETGNGGKVVLWSDNTTTFSGSISAQGGAASGDGGTVEVSGKKNLVYDGLTNTLAAHGQAGSLLLDSANVVVATSGGTITPDTINNNLDSNGTFTVQTGTSAAGGEGDIIVNSAITNSTDNKTLILKAYRNIMVKDNITLAGKSSNITLRADSTGRGTGTVSFAGGKKLTVNTTAKGGEIKIQYSPTAYTDDQSIFNSNMSAYTGRANTYFLINSLGTATDLDSAKTLGALSNNSNLWNKNYVLGKDIDASATRDWDNGSGFLPIGNKTTKYTGKFDGDGHVINGLYINRPTTDSVGLFGYVNNAAISNLGMTGGSITGQDYVGGLIGDCDDTGSVTITSSYNTGNVTGEILVGGLLGTGSGAVTITSSYNTGSVTGSGRDVGGLIGAGLDSVTIISSYNTGKVKGGCEESTGGLIGAGLGAVAITSSYNTGKVEGSKSVGGLLGSHRSSATVTITSSYNTGNVEGTHSVGGLIGSGLGAVTITSSYNTGNVKGTDFVGGLLGSRDDDDFVTITSSYNTGSVEGVKAVGGLLGSRSGYYAACSSAIVTITSSYNTGNVKGTDSVGGLIGSLSGYYPHGSGAVTITSSYNTGNVSGSSNIGGLVGQSVGNLTIDNNSFWATDAVLPVGAIGSKATQTVGSDGGIYTTAGKVTAAISPLPWQKFKLNGTSNLAPGTPVQLICDGALVTDASGTVRTEIIGADGKFSFADLSKAGNYVVVSTDPNNKAAYSAYISSLSDGVIPNTAQAGSFFDINLAKDTVITRNGTDTLVKALGSTINWEAPEYNYIPYDIVNTNHIRTKAGISLQAKDAYNLTPGNAFGAYLLGGNVTSGGSQTYDSVTVGYGDKTLTSMQGINVNNLLTVNRLPVPLTTPPTPTTPVTLTLSSDSAVSGTKGAILTDNLVLKGAGAFTLDGDNLVTTLATEGPTGAINYNNQGSLGIGRINAGSDTILIKAEGNITIDSGAKITTTSNSHKALQLVADGGNFFNESGSPTPFAVSGKWQVYSTSPLLDKLYGIESYDYKQYNIRFGDTIHATNSNALLYSVAPSVSVSLKGTYTKTYDGTTSIGTDFQNQVTGSMSGGITGDNLQAYTVDDTKITFDNKNVGDRTITFADGWLNSVLDGNGKAVYGYTVNAGAKTVTGKITPKAITITPNAGQSGTYNGTTTPTEIKYEHNGLATGDTVFTGALQLDRRNAGTNTIINNNLLVADGNYGKNYTYTITPGVTYTVNKRDLQVTGLTAANKVYNGDTAATLLGTAAVSPVSKDDVVLDGSAQGFFSDAKVGRNKTVTVSGLTLSGTDANNYTLLQPTGLTADIIPLVLPADNPPREQQRNIFQPPAGLKPLANSIPGLQPQVVEIEADGINLSSEAGSVISFLAKVNLEAITTEKAVLTLSDGYSAVPEWLHFDEKTMNLVGINVPEGALPITVIIHAGGKQTQVTVKNV